MNATISLAILDQLNAGRSLPEAVDAVLGAGTFAAVASEVYEALRQS